jgi:hypothetical protein
MITGHSQTALCGNDVESGGYADSDIYFGTGHGSFVTRLYLQRVHP